MGPISSTYEKLSDASWNEKLAAGILLAGILAIGLAPFWLNDLIDSDTQIIMNKVNEMKITLSP